jgi:hypothetical protein
MKKQEQSDKRNLVPILSKENRLAAGTQMGVPAAGERGEAGAKAYFLSATCRSRVAIVVLLTP